MEASAKVAAYKIGLGAHSAARRERRSQRQTRMHWKTIGKVFDAVKRGAFNTMAAAANIIYIRMC